MSNYKARIKEQIKLEMAHAKYNGIEYMKMFLQPIKQELLTLCETIQDEIRNFPEEKYFYVTKDGETKDWVGLREIHKHVLGMGTEAMMDFYYTAYLAVVPKHTPVTLQQVVGAVHGFCKGDIDGVKRQLQCVELLLMRTPYLIMDAPKGAEYAFISSQIKFSDDEMAVFKLHGTALPSIVRPRKVRNNFDIGYRTFKKSLIMGGKSHNKPCNLAHINRRNSVAFRIEPRVRDLVTPVFDEELKIKKNGMRENEQEREDRRTAWKDKQAVLPQKLAAVVGKTLYFNHRYDNRYRTYAEQYHINYQGDDHDKALVELAHKVEIDGDW